MIISIIIPSLNEGEFLGKTLSHTCSLAGHFEIKVVDGGSNDDTLEIVKKFSEVKLFRSKKGRGLQMNYGAKEASGHVLLFLHADTFLPKNTYQLITELFQDEKFKVGSFYLEFDDNHWAMRLYSWCSQINIPFFTYGDHGIFIRKSVFEEIQGFKISPLWRMWKFKGD